MSELVRSPSGIVHTLRLDCPFTRCGVRAADWPAHDPNHAGVFCVGCASVSRFGTGVDIVRDAA